MGREREVAQKQGQVQGQQPVAQTAKELVAVNPYNPDILPELENYVNDQVSHLCLPQYHLLSLCLSVSVLSKSQCFF